MPTRPANALLEENRPRKLNNSWQLPVLVLPRQTIGATVLLRYEMKKSEFLLINLPKTPLSRLRF